MLKVRPPTHKIDAGGLFIAVGDSWDQEKLEREYKILEDRALSALQEEALAKARAQNPGQDLTPEGEQAIKDSCKLSQAERIEAYGVHPWSRYFRGKTRYQPDAPELDPEGKPVKVRDYLKGEPTTFVIRRLAFADQRAAEEIESSAKRLEELCRSGLKEIRSPQGGLQWKAERGVDRVPDDILQALHEADASLINQIGNAVLIYGRPLDEEESKH